MTEAEAKEILEHYISPNGVGFPDVKEAIAVLLKKALEQEPKTEWIPVSERLPEEDGYYITTTLYREVYCDYWNGETFERTEIVLAWMPLPEPYKER